MSTRLYIYAPNIHSGGGRALLDSLLRSISTSKIINTRIFLDDRMVIPLEISTTTDIIRIKPTIFDRLRGEAILAKAVNDNDYVLCFGNLPPLIKSKGFCSVYLQNRFLIEENEIRKFPFKTRIRIFIEKHWFYWRRNNADEFIVQTPSMKLILSNLLCSPTPIRILPFTSNDANYLNKAYKSETLKEKKYDFIFVASGDPHKNHAKLIEAWIILAEQGVFPSLCLTLNKVQFKQLDERIELLKITHNLAIHNAGELSHREILKLYEISGALVFPSKLESFGLPLLEARDAGLPIIAAELDYVRDIIDPEETFDPNSALSIARAIKRHMRIKSPLLSILNSSQFLTDILMNFSSKKTFRN